jgi:hypothetical protein
MPLIFVLLASSAGTTVRGKIEQNIFLQQVSSLAYPYSSNTPIEVEVDHYETENVAAHTVTGGLQIEREAWAPATPFRGWPLETLEAAADTPVRISEPFPAFDRSVRTAHLSVECASRRRHPSKQELWVRRRLAPRRNF